MAGNNKAAIVEASWDGGTPPAASDQAPDASDVNITDGSLKGLDKDLLDIDTALTDLDAPANTSDEEPEQALPDRDGTMGDSDENSDNESDSDETHKEEEDGKSKAPASASETLSEDEVKAAEAIKAKLLTKYPNLAKRYKDESLEEILTNYNNGVDNLLKANDLARAMGISRDAFWQYATAATEGHLREVANIPAPQKAPAIDEALVNQLAEEMVISPDAVRNLLKAGVAMAKAELSPIIEQVQSSAVNQQKAESQAMWNQFWSEFSTAEATKDAAAKIGKDDLWNSVKEYEAEFPGGCARAVAEGKNPLDVALKYHLLQGKNFDLYLKLQGAAPKAKPKAPATGKQTGAGASPASRDSSPDNMSLPNLAKQYAKLTGDQSWESFGNI